jgi:hypothetical protein
MCPYSLMDKFFEGGRGMAVDWRWYFIQGRIFVRGSFVLRLEQPCPFMGEVMNGPDSGHSARSRKKR